MKRTLVLLYGILSYLIGLGGLVYFILFVGAWDFLPYHVDAGTPAPLGTALLVNIGLIMLFGLQHSIMARPAFKRALTKAIPHAAERSTYVLLSGVLMLLISFFWQPLQGLLWHVENQIGRMILTGGYLFGWAFAVLATFVINHFELFGLQQIYRNFRKQPEAQPAFTDRFLYRLVRHPLQLGVLIGIWVTPTMTMSHLLLAIAMTGYIAVGLYFEEKDLVAALGQEYEAYQARVPKILPIPKRTGQAAAVMPLETTPLEAVEA